MKRFRGIFSATFCQNIYQMCFRQFCDLLFYLKIHLITFIFPHVKVVSFCFIFSISSKVLLFDLLGFDTLGPIQIKRKRMRKFPLMKAAFSLIFFALASPFARCELTLTHNFRFRRELLVAKTLVFIEHFRGKCKRTGNVDCI